MTQIEKARAFGELHSKTDPVILYNIWDAGGAKAIGGAGAKAIATGSWSMAGAHMRIILDDALVYSDDDRIIKMFTALRRVAQDQQIIVFSCRQLAFQDLGGARPKVEIQGAYFRLRLDGLNYAIIQVDEI